MHLACRTTGPTSSGALDRRGVETPNLHAQKMISFILESPMKCKWQKGIKRKPSYIGCYGCPPVRSIVQKLLFHIEMRFESHNFLRERWSPWKICQGFCHIPTVYAVSPSDSKRFFRKSQPSTWKEVTHWWVGHYRQQVVQMKTMLSTQFPKHRNSHLHLLQVHGAILLLRLCEISFLRYQHGITWVGLKLMDQQTWECEFFLESQCILGMSRKLRHPCTFHSLYPSSPAT